MDREQLREEWQRTESAITRWTEANPDPDAEALAEYTRLAREARIALAAYEAAVRRTRRDR